MQTFLSIRSALTPQTLGVVAPFLIEFARDVGVDPKLVAQALMIQPPPLMPPGAPGSGGQPQGNAMDQVGNSMASAESMRSNAGELGAASKGQSQVSMAGAQP
jgi:hypothetical protein